MAGEPSNKVYMEPGGDRQVIASGGSLDVESGGEIDIESGAALKIAGTQVSASAADLNSAAKLVDSITVVAANAAADTVDVVITALDPDGNAIAVPTLLHVWLSDNANGLSGSAHTHSTAPAFTVGEEQVEMITNDSWLVLTNASGVATLRLLDTANEDVTINAGVPGTGLRGSDTSVAGDWSA